MAVIEPQMARTARIDFIDLSIKLVHIPLKDYARYLEPLLQMLFPLAESVPSNGHAAGWQSPSSNAGAWMNKHPFLNLSITPIECSIFCSTALAEQHFGPAAKHHANSAVISKEEFTAMSIEGDGLDAGQRVLELTTPLAMAGISIFFITTYFSDYILVPTRARDKVVEALAARGFVFEQHQGGPPSDPSSPTPQHRRMTNSSDLSNSGSGSTTVSELQSRTAALLQKHHIVPSVERGLRLIHCAGRSDASGAADLQLGLVRSLAHRPRFLSVTLTGTEPASLLVEPERAEAAFGGASGAAAGLARAEGDVLVPIVLDLGRLSLESSGIVCGLAGRLASEAASRASRRGDDPDAQDGAGAVEMSYLSTVRGAAVLVGADEVERAVAALQSVPGDGGGPVGGGMQIDA